MYVSIFMNLYFSLVSSVPSKKSSSVASKNPIQPRLLTRVWRNLVGVVFNADDKAVAGEGVDFAEFKESHKSKHRKLVIDVR